MADIDWNGPASLMRVFARATTPDSDEELLARGSVRELVGQALALDPAEQRGLLLRSASADQTWEYDEDAIRELAARPEYTGAFGDYDTAADAEDADRSQVADERTLLDGETTGPGTGNALGRDGER